MNLNVNTVELNRIIEVIRPEDKHHCVILHHQGGDNITTRLLHSPVMETETCSTNQ